MFCSKCGHTVPDDAQECARCGQVFDGNKFLTSSYTSAQSPVLPNGEPPIDLPRSALGVVVDEDNARREPGERTNYRPTETKTGLPQDAVRELKGEPEEEEPQPPEETYYCDIDYDSLSEGARNMLDEVKRDLQPEERIDRARFKSAEIMSEGQKGISQDVSDMLREMEEDEQRRSERRQQCKNVLPSLLNRRNHAAEVEDIPEEATETAPEDIPEEAAETQDGSVPETTEVAEVEDVEDVETPAKSKQVKQPKQDEVFDDLTDESLEDMRNPAFSLKSIIKISIGVIIAAALFIGVVMIVRNIKGSTSSAQIEAVSSDFYTQGVALISEHASDDYVNQMMSVYTESGSTGLATELLNGMNAVNALMPAEPMVNDELFLQALTTIESNIENCITYDALMGASGDQTTVDESAQRWEIVNNSVYQLTNATSAAELTAIINGEIVEIVDTSATATPEPVNQTTLSKGDKSDAVVDLQTRLWELGYLLDDRDGAFGSKTETAVKMFQQDAGLSVTGIADAATQEALYAEDAPKTVYAQATATPTPEPTAEPTATPEPVAETTDTTAETADATAETTDATAETAANE